MVVQPRQDWDGYNDPGPLNCPTRTHLALGKDAPLGQAVQRSGMSGLHHHYVFRKG
jgi:hypothetical protein